MKRTHSIAALAVLWLVALSSPQLVADDTLNPATTWPQWRGPGRDGQVPQGPKWPEKLQGDALQQLWRVELAPSYSGPIVNEELVFTTETKDGKTEVVTAFDRKSGDQRWQVEWPGAITVPFFAASNGSWIRATPAYDGKRLYVAGMRDVLVALEADTGEEVWRVDFVKELKTPVPEFGFVCSPLVDGDDLYVQAGASVVKLNKETGKIIWRTLEDGGGMMGSAFSSPIIATLHGQRQLVVQTREKLAGVDLATGNVLWSQKVPSFRGMNILTPTVVGDALFTSSYQNKSWLYQVAKQAEPATDEGTPFSVAEAWSNNAQGYMSSPVQIDGHAYLHLGNQRFTCIDLKTGERKWTSTPFGKYVSMASQGDRILALDERGELLLIAANPAEFKLVDRREVSEAETWAHIAIVGDEIYIRELNALAAWRWK